MPKKGDFQTCFRIDPCDPLLAGVPFQNQTVADNVSFDIVLASRPDGGLLILLIHGNCRIVRQGNIVVEEDAEMYVDLSAFGQS